MACCWLHAVLDEGGIRVVVLQQLDRSSICVRVRASRKLKGLTSLALVRDVFHRPATSHRQRQLPPLRLIRPDAAQGDVAQARLPRPRSLPSSSSSFPASSPSRSPSAEARVLLPMMLPLACPCSRYLFLDLLARRHVILVLIPDLLARRDFQHFQHLLLHLREFSPVGRERSYWQLCESEHSAAVEVKVCSELSEEEAGDEGLGGLQGEEEEDADPSRELNDLKHLDSIHQHELVKRDPVAQLTRKHTLVKARRRQVDSAGR
eukprot:762773-Hanusia_phi.AAC.2